MARSRDERGAVIPMVALLMTALLGITAIAVDIGHQRVERRDAQAIADMVALDMARHLDGRTRAVIKNTNEFKTGAGQSVARNLNVSPLPAVHVEPDQNDITVTVEKLPVVVTVTLGKFDATGGFTDIPNPAIPNAVRVTVNSSVEYAFRPGTGEVSRSAVASASNPTVCFSIGTKALALDTNQSVLSPVLSQILRVNLDAVGYEGIVDLKDVSVPLLGLAAELNAGSVDELLNTSVSIGAFSAALANALDASGDTASASLLEGLDINVPGLPIRIGDILNLDTTSGEAGLLGSVNVLDILTAGVVVANGDYGVGLTIPGLASLKITQPPQIACGGAGAVARSAQIELVVDAEIPGNPLIDSRLGVKVTVGDGEATLDAIGCDPNEKVTFTGKTDVASIGIPDGRSENLLLEVGLGQIPLLGPVLRTAVALLVGNPLHVSLILQGSVASSGATVEREYPIDRLPDTILLPPNGLENTLQIGYTDVSVANGGLLGLLKLNDLLDLLVQGVVTPLVNGTVNPLLTSILSPTLDALGIRLGVAEIDVRDRPNCAAVRLVR